MTSDGEIGRDNWKEKKKAEVRRGTEGRARTNIKYWCYPVSGQLDLATETGREKALRLGKVVPVPAFVDARAQAQAQAQKEDMEMEEQYGDEDDEDDDEDEGQLEIDSD
eukprot:CAMPEP_0202960248 /NCGR_PEP_ID=MMETSP1396-20130829/4396_1 /ASSEMBLY_ACC=CAM_ASM_000872 /TAXON_ID= /ORGANISM="Pseudokeronopsis sp., Strain Brazil" /LENGTH=108 /DNA_ID=CAMNT_0049679339 /DNA_START=684 /DNA_END=1009 /DNA_ORIENTATION=-